MAGFFSTFTFETPLAETRVYTCAFSHLTDLRGVPLSPGARVFITKVHQQHNYFFALFCILVPTWDDSRASFVVVSDNAL
jgi:hypothetical protein